MENTHELRQGQPGQGADGGLRNFPFCCMDDSTVDKTETAHVTRKSIHKEEWFYGHQII